MMREKQDIYKQFAATLLGNPEGCFTAPYSTDAAATGKINSALFISFHRLFVRDGIKRETFAMRLNYNLANASGVAAAFTDNLFQTMGTTERIYTDFGSSTNQPTTVGGPVGNIVRASQTSENVGLIFYDHGTIVLDVEKVFSKTDVGHGMIDAMTATASSGSAASVFAELETQRKEKEKRSRGRYNTNIRRSCFSWATKSWKYIPLLFHFWFYQ